MLPEQSPQGHTKTRTTPKQPWESQRKDAISRTQTKQTARHILHIVDHSTFEWCTSQSCLFILPTPQNVTCLYSHHEVPNHTTWSTQTQHTSHCPDPTQYPHRNSVEGSRQQKPRLIIPPKSFSDTSQYDPQLSDFVSHQSFHIGRSTVYCPNYRQRASNAFLVVGNCRASTKSICRLIADAGESCTLWS